MKPDYFQTNQKLWDQKTTIHQTSDFYDLEGFKKGKTSLQEIELAALADLVAGKRMLHLQCHFGQDSLAWARLGAKVTGVDFSPKAIQLAQKLNAELALDAEFVTSNIYDLTSHDLGSFDLVFTSYGVLTWLPDLAKWAATIDHFLKPNGLFYIAEFHPSIYMYDWTSHQLTYRYFSNPTPYEEEEMGTYANRSAAIQLKEYFWCHSLAEIIQPLLDQGLQLQEFKEFPWSPYNCFPNMQEVSTGRFVYGDLTNRLPHVFSLKMKKVK